MEDKSPVKRPTLRSPKPLSERIKLASLLLAFIAVSEWADPFPFYATVPAKLAVIAIVLVVAREFHHARLEVDPEWSGKSARVEAGIRRHAARVSKQTWLKLQRILTWVLVAYAFGMVINALTDRCDSAPQCAVLAPRMAIENLPMFVQFAVYVSLTLFQLFIMFWAMVKVGSFKIVMPGTVGVTFDDVWGQDQAKQRMVEQVQLLEDSERVEEAGGYMPKGVLLWGPPGTGKTMLAKAAANYSSKPLILVPPGAFQATFVGIDLLKVAVLFRTIRKLARRYGGVIVFFDEIDALGKRGNEDDRSKAAPSVTYTPGCVPRIAREQTEPRRIEPRQIVAGNYQSGALQAFLAAMDGMEEPRGLLNRILVFLGFKPLRPYEYKYMMLGATNRLGALDTALLRAGRFGRKIHVTYPKVEGRRRTYEGYLGKLQKHVLTPADVEWAARNHEKGTGADIDMIVNEALLITFRDGREDSGIVRFRDLVDAMIWVGFGESEGPFTREEARWNVAVHEAGHAVAFHLLCAERSRIWFASIEQRGEAGGMVAPTALHEDWLLKRSEMLADIQVSLASRVAEELIIGETTNGHGGDGQHATETAQRMVAYGHVGTVGVYPSSTRNVQRQTEEVLREALSSCRELLSDRKGDIERVARLLYERGTVPGDEIHSILEEAA